MLTRVRQLICLFKRELPGYFNEVSSLGLLFVLLAVSSFYSVCFLHISYRNTSLYSHEDSQLNGWIFFDVVARARSRGQGLIGGSRMQHQGEELPYSEYGEKYGGVILQGVCGVAVEAVKPNDDRDGGGNNGDGFP